MSYKKFSRNHGKTSRVKKYQWSNRDRRWSDSRGTQSAGRPSLRGYINVPESRIICGNYYGWANGPGLKSGMARKDRRKLRRHLDIKIRIWYH